MAQQPPPYNPYYGNQPYPPPPPDQGGPPMGGMPPPPPAFHAYGPGGPMPPQYATNGDPEVAGHPLEKQPIQFCEKDIRRSFIRKVYIVMALMLLVCFGMTSLAVFHDKTKLFVRQNTWLYFVSYAVFMVTYLMIVCCTGFRRKFPGNVICLALLTLSVGYMTMMISAYHKTTIVFAAMGICMGVCTAITLFAMNTKYDFTSWIGVMFVISMVLMFFGIFAIIFRSQIMYMVYAGLAALVFMVYLAIDTQMIMGGKKHEISEEDWVYAATQLFVDIVYIFWFLMQLMGAASD